MNTAAVTCFLFVLTGLCRAADWPGDTRLLMAGSGARCEMKIWSGATGEQPEWEGRTLAREQRIRIINRRTRGVIDPGPEELLWTGEGAIQFMGGRPETFAPKSRLSLLESYLFVELLVPLWSPSQAQSGDRRTLLKGPFGDGYITVQEDGRPESLVVKRLSRPLFDGSSTVIVVYGPSDDDSPWQAATVFSAADKPLLRFERQRFKRGEIDDEFFEVEQTDGLTLADLSRPLGQLLGSDSGDYTETAGAQGLWDDGGAGRSAGPVYIGYRVSAAEVDAFLREGGLGRYGNVR